MNNLAVTYRSLGRLEDALAMSERVLEYWSRVLPENHPDIGEVHEILPVPCDASHLLLVL